jgi:hypothetical protein
LETLTMQTSLLPPPASAPVAEPSVVEFDTSAPSAEDKASKWGSGRLRALLRARHAAPEWALFEELPDATGFDKRRTFDAYAMHTWPSKGFRCVGYEIKTSRSDFKREIEDPTKRAPLEAVAHEVYFLTSPGLVKLDEVPEGWGLIEPRGDTLTVRKAATQRRLEALPWKLVASIARRAVEPSDLPPLAWRLAERTMTEAEFRELVKEMAREQIVDAERRASTAEDRHKTRADEARRLQSIVDEVERVAGLPRHSLYSSEAVRQDLFPLLSGGLRPEQAAALRKMAQQILAVVGDPTSTVPAVPE